ncbi:uncharacterized protein BO80DRAFT_422508 [Aspergillus ibericus CBS 121593]|uniref:Uncharacterized protein n=1 Tax=Aspergillus ibericus CBS 121593 TaxID=1448316 RepID=A0A395HD24_9EURO|nr:hypothetical protein BO80DRAFT_422508 [Aspergillus ibericus CBS 121593]RAL04134.1 hypothetical protein BO80DRAFT_422508 [Aspergillus ibericus CBS 121593]
MPAKFEASFSVAIKPGRIGHAAPPAPELLSQKNSHLRRKQVCSSSVGRRAARCSLLALPSGNASPTHRFGYLPFWDIPAGTERRRPRRNATIRAP